MVFCCCLLWIYLVGRLALDTSLDWLICSCTLLGGYFNLGGTLCLRDEKNATVTVFECSLWIALYILDGSWKHAGMVVSVYSS